MVRTSGVACSSPSKPKTGRMRLTLCPRQQQPWHGMADGMAEVCEGMVRHGTAWHERSVKRHGMAWHGMAEVCEGAPVAVGGWVLTDRHGLAPCAANILHRVTVSLFPNDMAGGTTIPYHTIRENSA